MTPSAEQVEAGQAIYTKSVLRFYDFFVLGMSARLIWRCPAKPILNLYQQHASANHLDVGVGTGFFLDRCAWPVKQPRIALMDINPNCLEVAKQRIARYRPEVYRANVLDPIKLQIPKFDSIGLTWVLHCLPGTISTKASVVEHLKTLLNPGGMFFGATLLNGGVRHTAISKRLTNAYNAKGIFTNLHDDAAGLKRMLGEHLTETKVEVIGCSALFCGKA
jgi:2-polyprenyl-3-methyl-5-hydroxy-6-metoxy-1,4-benzoquinol methylase